MNAKEKIDLGFAAIGGRTFDPRACRCDPDVGAVPCHYCAEHTALEAAEGLERENATLREDKALLDAFDLAGRKDDVQAHQISEDECEPELLGHFWQTPTVQSTSCREAIRAAIGTQP